MGLACQGYNFERGTGKVNEQKTKTNKLLRAITSSKKLKPVSKKGESIFGFGIDRVAPNLPGAVQAQGNFALSSILLNGGELDYVMVPRGV